MAQAQCGKLLIDRGRVQGFRDVSVEGLSGEAVCLAVKQ